LTKTLLVFEFDIIKGIFSVLPIFAKSFAEYANYMNMLSESSFRERPFLTSNLRSPPHSKSVVHSSIVVTKVPYHADFFFFLSILLSFSW